VSLPPPSGTSFHLLIIDDIPSNLRVAQLILAGDGHTVELAGDAETGLRLLAERSYDAVLMDCQMPVLDGYEATRRIRSGLIPGVNPRIPIIAVTAHALPDDRGKCLACGMDDYVPKPIRAGDLLAALQRQILSPGTVRSTEPPPASEAVEVPPDLDPETMEIARSLPGVNGPSLLPELIALYLVEQPKQLLRIATAYQTQSLTELADHAHRLAGDAATFGAFAVRHAALHLERAAREADALAIETRWHELCTAAAGLRPALARHNLLPS